MALPILNDVKMSVFLYDPNLRIYSIRVRKKNQSVKDR